MKKFFRFIGILILILVVGFLLICAIAPKDYTLERSTSIKGSKQAVMDQFVYFKNWVHWNPFREMDTTMVVTIDGTDGQPGSSYHWVGADKKSGEGIMTNKGVADDKMSIDMQFIKPFKATPTSWFKAEDATDGMVKVTWGYHDNYSFFMAGMMKTMTMFGMGLDKSFDRGLELMKNYVESNPESNQAGASGMDIKETQFAAHTYAGVRQVVGWNDMNKFFMDNYSALGKSLKGINGPATSLYWTWDTVKHEADMAAVFPVPDAAAAKGATEFDVPATKAYMIAYQGPYSGMKAAHNALGKYLMNKNEQMGLVIEEYVKNDMNEKDSTKWVTNIYYLVK